jgi:hypothetical protein
MSMVEGTSNGWWLRLSFPRRTVPNLWDAGLEPGELQTYHFKEEDLGAFEMK